MMDTTGRYYSTPQTKQYNQVQQSESSMQPSQLVPKDISQQTQTQTQTQNTRQVYNNGVTNGIPSELRLTIPEPVLLPSQYSSSSSSSQQVSQQVSQQDMYGQQVLHVPPVVAMTPSAQDIVQIDPGLKQEYEKMFQRMIEQIKIRSQEIEIFKALYDSLIEKKDYFDDEDVEVVGNQLNQKINELSQLQQDYNNKIQFYQTILVTLRNTLMTRQSILDDIDRKTRVLSSHRDMCEFFVKKQQNLKRMYEESCHKLVQH